MISDGLEENISNAFHQWKHKGRIQLAWTPAGQRQNILPTGTFSG